MARGNVEIEIKYPLKNRGQIAMFLGKNAEAAAQGVTQKDTYYTPKHRDFLAEQYPYEWLRIRETQHRASVTYKHFYPAKIEKHTHADEFEYNISDPSACEKMFLALDFKKRVVVDKTRDTWNYKEVEIALDSVLGLGDYIEIEATTEYHDPHEAKAYIRTILKEVAAEVGEEDLRGYPYVLLAKQGYRFGQ